MKKKLSGLKLNKSIISNFKISSNELNQIKGGYSNANNDCSRYMTCSYNECPTDESYCSNCS